MEEIETHITKWNKVVWEGYPLYNSIYVIFWKRQNYVCIQKLEISCCNVNTLNMADFI
jgi:hypothetical protein